MTLIFAILFILTCYAVSQIGGKGSDDFNNYTMKHLFFFLLLFAATFTQAQVTVLGPRPSKPCKPTQVLYYYNSEGHRDKIECHEVLKTKEFYVARTVCSTGSRNDTIRISNVLGVKPIKP